MGSPQSPTSAQTTELERAGQLARLEDETVAVRDGGATMRFDLGRQGVALLVISSPEH
jgi:xylan 1,4-beta-xylosidase